MRNPKSKFTQLRDKAPTWLKKLWATSKKNGTDKLTMRQINTEISIVRRRRARKRSLQYQKVCLPSFLKIAHSPSVDLVPIIHPEPKRAERFFELPYR
jgi:hypothetical protein